MIRGISLFALFLSPFSLFAQKVQVKIKCADGHFIMREYNSYDECNCREWAVDYYKCVNGVKVNEKGGSASASTREGVLRKIEEDIKLFGKDDCWGGMTHKSHSDIYCNDHSLCGETPNTHRTNYTIKPDVVPGNNKNYQTPNIYNVDTKDINKSITDINNIIQKNIKDREEREEARIDARYNAEIAKRERLKAEKREEQEERNRIKLEFDAKNDANLLQNKFLNNLYFRNLGENFESNINSMKFNNLIKNVILTGDGGYCILYGDNGFNIVNEPKIFIEKLNELHSQNVKIDQVLLLGQSSFIIVADGYGIGVNIPNELVSAIDDCNRLKLRINNIAVSPDGSWVIIKEQNGYVTHGIPPSLLDKLKVLNENHSTINFVTFTPWNGWLVIWNDYSYAYENFPTNIGTKLNEYQSKKLKIHFVALRDGNSFIIN